MTPGIASAALVSMLRDARVRHRAEQQLREQHPLGAEVFGVFRLPGDLRDEIRGGVVLADEFSSHKDLRVKLRTEELRKLWTEAEELERRILELRTEELLNFAPELLSS